MGKFRIGFDSNFSSLWFCTVNWVFWVLQFVFQFFELDLSYYLIFVVFRLWDGEIRIGFDSNFSSLWLCTANWVFGFCNLCSILGLLRIVVVITRPWTDLIRKCCIHRSKSLLKPRSSGISRFASCFDLLARSRLII